MLQISAAQAIVVRSAGTSLEFQRRSDFRQIISANSPGDPMTMSNKKPIRRRNVRKLSMEPLEPRLVLSTLGTFDNGKWEIDRNDNHTWDGAGAGDERTNFGIFGDTAVAGDWDGDGTDELGIFRGGNWFFDLDGEGGKAESTLTYGIPGDIPVVGDWDGDGVDEVAIFRDGVWYFDLDGAGGVGEKARTFGVPSDVPVAGDWDGDGIDEMGVFRNGRWFFDLDDAGGFAEKTVTFGIGGDRAAYGDWDGDGVDDLAVFRAGAWFFDLDGAGGAGEKAAVFGNAGVVPLIIGHGPLVDPGSNVGVRVGQTISFSGNVKPRFAEQLTSFSWDFGDGTTAGNTLNPSHKYSQHGSYTVTLTATNQAGRTFEGQLTATIYQVVALDAAWLAAREAPFLLDSPQTEYVLQTDVRVDGTAFITGAADVMLNLNGHTITYGDSAPLVVANGGFEQGSSPTDVPGWDLSQVPGAQRVSARTGMWGDWMLHVDPIDHEVAIKSEPIAIPEANREYAASITVKMNQGAARLFVVDAVTGDVLGSHRTAGGRGFANVAQFVPTTTNPVFLRLVLTPPDGQLARYDIDHATLTVSRDFGVVASSSWWYLPDHLLTFKVKKAAEEAKNFTLKNGTVIHGQGRGYASDPLFARSLNTLTVKGVDLKAAGMDSENVNAQGARNVTVKNSTMRADIDRISNRMLIFAAIDLEHAGGTIRVDNNRVLGYPQAGIYVGGGNDIEITNNEIRQDAIVTNGYGIFLGGRNFKVVGNTIIPVKGRGITLDEAATGSMENGEIAGNYVEVYEMPNLEFGVNGLEATALRIRAGQVDAYVRNVHIHDNSFIARTDSAGVHAAIGARIKQANNMTNSNNLIENNLFKAIVGTTDGGFSAQALSIAQVDAGTGLVIARNTLESNHTSLVVGDRQAWEKHTNDILFLSNTIKKSADGAAVSYDSIIVGSGRTDVHNIRFIDMRYAGGATSQIVFERDKKKDVSIGWLLNVVVRAGGNPVAGATVRIFDRDNNEVFVGSTDANGHLDGIQVITSILAQETFDPDAITTNTRGPHRIHVTQVGYVAFSSTLTIDQSTTVFADLRAS